MKSFKRHLAESVSRSSHLEWGPGDIEHHFNEENLPPIRLDHHSRYPENTELHHDDMKSHEAAVRAAYEVREHRKALESYKDSSSPYNGYLRDMDNHRENGIAGHYNIHHDATIRHLDNLVGGSTLSKPASVYRGFSHSFPIHHLKEGHEFTDHGFTGTSLTLNKGRAFGLDHVSHYDMDTGKDIQTHPAKDHWINRAKTFSMIHMPAGTRGLFIDHPGNHPGGFGIQSENEFLLHRGSRFKVMGHSRIEHPWTGDMHIVHLQLKGQDPKPYLDREPSKVLKAAGETLQKHGWKKEPHPKIPYEETHTHEHFGKIHFMDGSGFWSHETHSGSFINNDHASALEDHLKKTATHGVSVMSHHRFDTWKAEGWKHDRSSADHPETSTWHHPKSNSVLQINKKTGVWKHDLVKDGTTKPFDSGTVQYLGMHMSNFNEMHKAIK